MATNSSAQFKVVPQARIWERQPAESPQAYEAFCTYLQVLDEKAGGQREVARRVGKAQALIQRWSKRWSWVERHRAYENNRLIIEENEQRNAAREEAKQWQKRRKDIREEGFDVGDRLLARAKSLLSLPVTKTVQKSTFKDEDGNEVLYNGQPIPTETHLIFQQHPRDARLFAETGLKLKRLSADMTTDNIGIPENVDFDSMSDEELDAYISKMHELRDLSILGKVKDE